MPRRWHQFRNPWDREYAMRGALWRGTEEAIFLQPHLGPGTPVVELGCGDGKFLEGLSAAGFRPMGVDFSRHALRRARDRLVGPLVAADVRLLPFRDGSVPAVAARHVLGALDEPGRRRAAREITRVLAPGAWLLVEEFSPADFRYGTGTEVGPATYERNRGILTHYFTKDEVPELFPALKPVLLDEREHAQKTREGARRRHRFRWLFQA